MNAFGGSARKSLAPRLVGDETPKRVGRFDLVTRLGAGGMANVFLARHQGEAGFERLAAIKLLHRHLSSDEQFVQMFFDEARVAARIHHPNVVPILEIGSEHDQLYMVMDYVEGDTLAAVQRAAIGVRRAIPVGIVLRIVLDALAGLECAHDLVGPDGEPLNVVHRDVSPQNILVGLDGVSRVVDFGIARAERRLAFTTVGTLKGKAPFMSPEQLEGQAVDRRADVFAMGVTMWESFALRRLYPQRSDVETVTRANRVAYRPLKAMLAHLPPAVDEIVQRALAFDAEDRFSGAGEFAEAIEDELRADIATHRQVTTFMAAIAGEKVAAEREALRATPSVAPPRPVAVRHRYESGVHASGRTIAPGDFGVPPPPPMPDLAGLPELESSPRGGLPDLPDLDVATSVSHLTASVAPRALANAAQSGRRPRSASPTLAQYSNVPSNDGLVEPEPLSVRPTGGGVQVVRSQILGGAPQAPRRPQAKGTPPMGVPSGLGAPPRRAEALAPRPPAPPPPPRAAAPQGDTGRDIEEMLQRLGVDDLAPLDEAISAVSSVRSAQGNSVRQQTPAWGSGAPTPPSAGVRGAFAPARGSGMPSSVPTPAMGSVLPRPGVTKVHKSPPPAGRSDRHAALADASGRFKPAQDDELMQTTRIAALRDDFDAPIAASPRLDADSTQEKRLPQTFMAPPEASNAHLFTNAAAMVSLLSVAGILWLVLR